MLSFSSQTREPLLVQLDRSLILACRLFDRKSQPRKTERRRYLFIYLLYSLLYIQWSEDDMLSVTSVSVSGMLFLLFLRSR
jgi:hypothetical protein